MKSNQITLQNVLWKKVIQVQLFDTFLLNYFIHSQYGNMFS